MNIEELINKFKTGEKPKGEDFAELIRLCYDTFNSVDGITLINESGVLEIGSVGRENLNFYKRLFNNLIDKDSTDLDFSGYYDLSGNYTVPSSWDAGFGSTGFVKIKPDTTYYTNVSGFVTFWDENKVFLSGLHFQNPGTFNTPNGCFYVNSAILLSDIDNLMIVEGNEPNVITGSGERYIDEKLLVESKQIKNEIFGLKWNVLGDSISTNDYSNLSYYQLIASNNNIKVNNYGVSSTTISVGSRSDAMCERYLNMTDEADIITVFGGINDYGENLSIGTINDSSKETFMGALNVLCKGLINKYPGKRIGFITPMQYREADKVRLLSYVDAIKEVCGMYSIPVLDLFREGNLFPSDDYINNTYFTNSDGLHPNSEGHKIISRRIEAFLKSL